jgi:hypothetical protein
VTRANTDNQPDPFAEFINQHLYLGDDNFTPIIHPTPTDTRWHYGQYRASVPVSLYSQPNRLYAYDYALRPTNGYAHALLRYLSDIRPGWTAIELSIGNPLIGYVRNEAVTFRRTSGVYEYMLLFMISALMVVGLSVLMFLYTIPQNKMRASNSMMIESSPFVQCVERFVARLEVSLLPVR